MNTEPCRACHGTGKLRYEGKIIPCVLCCVQRWKLGTLMEVK